MSKLVVSHGGERFAFFSRGTSLKPGRRSNAFSRRDDLFFLVDESSESDCSGSKKLSLSSSDVPVHDIKVWQVKHQSCFECDVIVLRQDSCNT